MRYFVFFFCFLSTITFVLEAQQKITGHIFDATDESPVAGASIFVANTTIGTTSDENGRYTIIVAGEGSFEIVVSHVGYQPVFHKINAPKPSHQIDVILEIKELQELTIMPNDKSYSQKDVDLFWLKLLGVKPSKKGLEVLNPEKVFFYLNSDNVLKVSCDTPIEIVNHDLGYHIWYFLKSFQHDYRKNGTTFYGQPFFEELTPQNDRQKKMWEKNRQLVYSVSLIRFFRALYREQIYEEGFFLINRDSLRRAKTRFPLQEIRIAGENHVQLDIRTPLYLACVSKPITDTMIQNTYYTVFSSGKTFPVMILFPQQLTVYPDGTYSGLLEIRELRDSIIGLSCMLPSDYR